MADIGAILDRDGAPLDRSIVARMSERLSPPGASRHSLLEGPVGLVSAGREPVRGGGGRFAMVFDGRLDHRSELIEALGLASPRSDLDDAELAMRSWETWGETAPGHWFGDFAAIVWDREAARLTAIRHQFGHRTLSYASSHSVTVVASSASAVLATRVVERKVDMQKVADMLSNHFADAERSFFEQVRRVAPAHMLIVDRSTMSQRPYYELETAARPVHLRDDAEYLEQAEELLRRSLSSCLKDGDKPGAFLSGGLDSSTIAWYAAQSLGNDGGKLPTYTWIPEAGWDGRVQDGRFGDESRRVKELAQVEPALLPHFIDSAGLGQFHMQDELLEATDAPIQAALNVQWLHAILQRAKEHGVTKMLDGTMGNLTYSFDGRSSIEQEIRSRSWLKVAASALVGRTPIGQSWRPLLKHLFRHRGRSALEMVGAIPLAAQLWLRDAMVNEGFGRRHGFPDRIIAEGRFYFDPIGRDPRDLLPHILMNEVAPDIGNIHRGLRNLYGIELCDPFADRKIVEWCLGLPDDQFFRNSQPRSLIRRLMASRLPRSYLDEQLRRGQQTSDWHLRLTRDLARIEGELERFSANPTIAAAIDIDRLTSLVRNWPAETIIDPHDDRRFHLPLHLPMALQVGRFMELNGV